MLQFVLPFVGVIMLRDIIKDDDNDANPDHVEKIIEKMPDEIRKFIG